jgi:hypothetical protein
VATVEVTIKAIDKMTPTTERVRGSLGGLTDGFKTAGLVIAGFVAAGYAVNRVLDATVGSWKRNTLAIADFADKIGASTEDASVLMEIAADLGVELGALEMGFKTMARQGIQPSVEGLIEVKHRLESAGSESQRLAMAQKLLGRTGADLLPVFAQLNDKQLREYIENMGEGQIVTKEEAARARELRDTMDDLGDAWKNVTLEIGGFLAAGAIEELQSLALILGGDVKSGIELLRLHFRGLADDVKNVGSEAHGMDRDFSLAAGAADDLTEAIGNLPGGKRTFTYSLKMQVPSDVQELARLMHWSIAKAAAYLISGGAEAGATAEAFLTAQNNLNAPGVSKTNTTFQHGGSFIVPGSGSGDRPYVVQLEPGERVDVTPRNQVKNFTFNTNVSDGTDGAVLLSKFQDAARRS